MSNAIELRRLFRIERQDLNSWRRFQPFGHPSPKLCANLGRLLFERDVLGLLVGGHRTVLLHFHANANHLLIGPIIDLRVRASSMA